MSKIRMAIVAVVLALSAAAGVAHTASAVTVFPEGCGDCGPWKR